MTEKQDSIQPRERETQLKGEEREKREREREMRERNETKKGQGRSHGSKTRPGGAKQSFGSLCSRPMVDLDKRILTSIPLYMMDISPISDSCISPIISLLRIIFTVNIQRASGSVIRICQILMSIPVARRTDTKITVEIHGHRQAPSNSVCPTVIPRFHGSFPLSI